MKSFLLILVFALQSGPKANWIRTTDQDRMTDQVSVLYTNLSAVHSDATLAVACDAESAIVTLSTATSMAYGDHSEIMIRYDHDPAITEGLELSRDSKMAFLRDAPLEMLRHHRMLVRVDMASGRSLETEFELDGLDRLQFTHDCFRPHIID